MKRIILSILILLPAFLWAQETLNVLQNLHQVKKGETVESVAELYGITEQQLRLANPDIKKNKLKKGKFIIIPPKEEPAFIDIETPVVQEPEPVDPRIETIRMAVLLPLEENSDKGKKMIEFYQGMLMAVDSIKKEGTNVEVFAYHSGKGEEEIRAVLQKEEMSTMNVIFGPADQAQIPALTEYCADRSIRLVLPFSAPSVNLVGRPLIYQATANSGLLQTEMADVMAANSENRNFIILSTSNPDERGRNAINALRNALNDKGITIQQMPLDGDDFAYESALNQFHENVIIPDNTSIKTLNVFFAKMKTFVDEHPQYKISMLGYPEWQTYTKSLLPQFYAFNTYIYTAYYRNPLLDRTSIFERTFMNNFHRPMQATFPRFGMMGFDLAYYFLHALGAYGNAMEGHLAELMYQPFQHPFQFRQDAEGDGFVNHAVMFVHYTTDQTIEIK